jgi:hypothetical protein
LKVKLPNQSQQNCRNAFAFKETQNARQSVSAREKPLLSRFDMKAAQHWSQNDQHRQLRAQQPSNCRAVNVAAADSPRGEETCIGAAIADSYPDLLGALRAMALVSRLPTIHVDPRVRVAANEMHADE